MVPNNGGAVRVLIIDDSSTMRDIVALVLSSSSRISVAGGAATGQEAIDIVVDQAIDVATVDLELPDIDGIELVSQLLALDRCGVVVISGSPENAAKAPWRELVPMFPKSELVENRQTLIAAVFSAAAQRPERQAGAMIGASRAYRRRPGAGAVPSETRFTVHGSSPIVRRR